MCFRSSTLPYVLANVNDNACPGNNKSAIPNAAECKVCADSIPDYSYRGIETAANFPKGCYLYQMYFLKFSYPEQLTPQKISDFGTKLEILFDMSLEIFDVSCKILTYACDKIYSFSISPL